MLQDSILSQNDFEFTDTLVSDSVIAPVIELINNPISLKQSENNWGFILFFVCFLIIVSMVSKKNKFFLSLFSRLFRNKDRNSMFFETVTNETLNKCFLCFQTIILLSIITYCYAVYENYILIISLKEMLIFTSKISFLLLIFL